VAATPAVPPPRPEPLLARPRCVRAPLRARPAACAPRCVRAPLRARPAACAPRCVRRPAACSPRCVRRPAACSPGARAQRAPCAQPPKGPSDTPRVVGEMTQNHARCDVLASPEGCPPRLWCRPTSISAPILMLRWASSGDHAAGQTVRHMTIHDREHGAQFGQGRASQPDTGSRDEQPLGRALEPPDCPRRTRGPGRRWVSGSGHGGVSAVDDPDPGPGRRRTAAAAALPREMRHPTGAAAMWRTRSRFTPDPRREMEGSTTGISWKAGDRRADFPPAAGSTRVLRKKPDPRRQVFHELHAPGRRDGVSPDSAPGDPRHRPDPHIPSFAVVDPPARDPI
jgi:hypothetical protein